MSVDKASLKFVTFLIRPSLRIVPEPSVVVESLDACFPRRSNLLTPKANTPTIALPRAGMVLIHFGPLVLIVENTRAERSCKFHSLPRDRNRLKMGERHRGHGRSHHGYKLVSIQVLVSVVRQIRDRLTIEG